MGGFYCVCSSLCSVQRGAGRVKRIGESNFFTLTKLLANSCHGFGVSTAIQMPLSALSWYSSQGMYYQEDVSWHFCNTILCSIFQSISLTIDFLHIQFPLLVLCAFPRETFLQVMGLRSSDNMQIMKGNERLCSSLNGFQWRQG